MSTTTYTFLRNKKNVNNFRLKKSALSGAMLGCISASFFFFFFFFFCYALEYGGGHIILPSSIHLCVRPGEHQRFRGYFWDILDIIMEN